MISVRLAFWAGVASMAALASLALTLLDLLLKLVLLGLVVAVGYHLTRDLAARVRGKLRYSAPVRFVQELHIANTLLWSVQLLRKGFALRGRF